tara:strand:- start:1217 stop:1750 length:534 start_codon:yes stop_codon:yes gene_type:complete
MVCECGNENCKPRYIYEITYGKSIYVGLGVNPQGRFASHKRSKDKAIANAAKRGKFAITQGPICEYQAAKIEYETVERYRNDPTRKLLNRDQGGSLGNDKSVFLQELDKKSSIRFLNKNKLQIAGFEQDLKNGKDKYGRSPTAIMESIAYRRAHIEDVYVRYPDLRPKGFLRWMFGL